MERTKLIIRIPLNSYLSPVTSFCLHVFSQLGIEQTKLHQGHQRQLEHVQKASEANVDRVRRKMEAEISELTKVLSRFNATGL